MYLAGVTRILIRVQMNMRYVDDRRFSYGYMTNLRPLVDSWDYFTGNYWPVTVQIVNFQWFCDCSTYSLARQFISFPYIFDFFRLPNNTSCCVHFSIFFMS